MEFLVFNKSQFFLPHLAQFDKSVNLFCLVFLTSEFPDTMFFHCFYYTEVFISSFISLYSLNTLFIDTNSS